MSRFEVLIFIVFIVTVIFFSTQWWLRPKKTAGNVRKVAIEPTESPELPPWGDSHKREPHFRDEDFFADENLNMGFTDKEPLFAKEDAIIDPLFEPLPPRTEKKITPAEKPK